MHERWLQFPPVGTTKHTNFNNVTSRSVGTDLSDILFKASLKHSKPSSFAMLLYKPTTSTEAGKVTSGSVVKFSDLA
jgi:hypothetical protein